MATGMSRERASMEAVFLRLCRERGPEWVESVVRPLRLAGDAISAKDIPLNALATIVRVFGPVRRRTQRVSD